MALANFALTQTVSPVDKPTVVTTLIVTGPDGVALPTITIPKDAVTVSTPALTQTGTYTYVIANVDDAGVPVTNLGVAYPTVTGSFSSTGTGGGTTASIVTAATVTVA